MPPAIAAEDEEVLALYPNVTSQPDAKVLELLCVDGGFPLLARLSIFIEEPDRYVTEKSAVVGEYDAAVRYRIP